jgi:hypothetical protein
MSGHLAWAEMQLHATYAPTMVGMFQELFTAPQTPDLSHINRSLRLYISGIFSLAMTSLSATTKSVSGNSTKRPDNRKAEALRSLEQPSPRAAEYIDTEELAKIEKSAELVHGFLRPSKVSSIRRAFLACVIGASGTSLTTSGASLPTANLGATSNVFREVSKEIDDVLQRGEGILRQK